MFESNVSSRRVSYLWAAGGLQWWLLGCPLLLSSGLTLLSGSACHRPARLFSVLLALRAVVRRRICF